MHDAIQRAAERLGAALKRPVAIDDARLRLLAFSSVEPESQDPVRRDSILTRAVTAEMRAWITAHRREGEGSVFVVPANPALGADYPRWGAPATANGRPAGFVWVLVQHGELTQSEQRQLLATASEVGRELERQFLFDELRALREREGLGGLLGTDPNLQLVAAARIVETGLFEPETDFSLFVVMPVAKVHPPGGEDESGRTREIERTVESARLLFPSTQFIATVRRDHAVIVCARPSTTSARRYRTSHEIAEALANVFEATFPSPAFRLYIGIGRRRRQLLHAHMSYREAFQAAQVSAAIEALGSPIHYNRLGVYGRIAGLAWSEPDWDTLHPGIRKLLERSESGDELARTLEVFLDCAGNATTAAERLHLHRASLYGRVKRIEQVTGLDLSDGHDRLVAHLELKVARLIRGLPAS